MKCTNRRMISCLLFLSFVLTGCSKNTIPMQYESKQNVTTYQIENLNDSQVADSFAKKLCVTDVDVTQGTNVKLDDVGAAGLFDVKNAKVMYAKNIHEKLYPASLTKVMTALVALKYGNLNDTIVVSKNAAQITESGAQLCGLKEGDTLTLDQALHALLIYSGNDAGVVIAEHIAGSVEAFADMMNEEAKNIGATNSHFVNPHGLSDNNHYVTAYDMYLMFNEAMKFEKFNEIVHMTTYSTIYHDKEGKEKELNFGTTNQYLKEVYKAPDNVTIIGGKTGTTNAAGNCLILSSKDSSGNPYISIILRSKQRDLLYQNMTDLLDEI